MGSTTNNLLGICREPLVVVFLEVEKEIEEWAYRYAHTTIPGPSYAMMRVLPFVVVSLFAMQRGHYIAR